MPLNELISIAAALTAPAFFLLFGLAALGAPLLALMCLASSHLYNTQYIEAFARRLLRLALTAAVPALVALVMLCALLFHKVPWTLDWLLASALAPGLLVVAVLTFFASLLTVRLSRPSARHARQNSPIGQAFVLSLLSLLILWLSLVLGNGLLEQGKAVQMATAAISTTGQASDTPNLTVAPLLPLDATTLPSVLWLALAALGPLSIACAGVLSLEHLLLRRDREPFGREALTQMLRIAARSSLRSALLAAAFLPVLWTHLPEMPALPELLLAAKILLGLAGACALLLMLCAGYLARSGRPWAHGIAAHATVLAAWACLTLLLCVALFCFYGA